MDAVDTEATKPRTKWKKLTNVRGGHRVDFTRLGQKKEEFTATAIDTQSSFFLCEALLTAIQDKTEIENRFDSENNQSIDDPEELTRKLDQSSELQVTASTTIAHLSELIEKYIKATEKIQQFTLKQSTQLGQVK